MYRYRNTGVSKHVDFVIIDCLCMQLAFVLAFIIRHGIVNPYSLDKYRNAGVTLVLLEVLCSILLSSYRNILKRNKVKEFLQVTKNNTVVIGSFLAYSFILHTSYSYSRITFLLTWIFSITIIFIVHIAWKKIIIRQVVRGKKWRHLLIVSTKENINEVLIKLGVNGICDFDVVGIILEDEQEQTSSIQGIPVIGHDEHALDLLPALVVDEVFVCLPRNSYLYQVVLKQCYDMGITSHVYLEFVEHMGGDKVFEKIGRCPVITNTMKLSTANQQVVKRLVDIVGSLVGLLIMAVAMVIVVPGIMLSSPGPIFFSQERVGKNGRKFRIYKFRSMCMGAEHQQEALLAQNEMSGFMFKIKDDPRVFGFGSFMRKTSIDELPQFFNVLKGDMSLVGTRPPTVEEYAQYEHRHMKRLASKPGLTGMWQVSGRSKIDDFEEVVKLDSEYIEKWSPLLDVKIILKTIVVVFARRGSE